MLQCDWLLGDRQGGVGDVNEGLDQSRYVNPMSFYFCFVFSQRYDMKTFLAIKAF